VLGYSSMLAGYGAAKDWLHSVVEQPNIRRRLTWAVVGVGFAFALRTCWRKQARISSSRQIAKRKRDERDAKLNSVEVLIFLFVVKHLTSDSRIPLTKMQENIWRLARYQLKRSLESCKQGRLKLWRR